eukprot:TRINITY_DN51_c0_g1_i3.p3 TRINITY_DN51_c0_g1~~TRINITY_DN51_c0_g1_i3.p3  ORF type:complete len:68 (+),score=12.89 TRINITY_DN51_c0_g1_i3:1007-1210(+)
MVREKPEKPQAAPVNVELEVEKPKKFRRNEIDALFATKKSHSRLNSIVNALMCFVGNIGTHLNTHVM